VTGTDADLRKLSKTEIKQKLLGLGYRESALENCTRWEMVQYLRDISSQAVQEGDEGDMKKYARGVRFTSKIQKERYQENVNQQFKKQIQMLSPYLAEA
jgi:transcription initiation factor TFIID subunit 1